MTHRPRGIAAIVMGVVAIIVAVAAAGGLAWWLTRSAPTAEETALGYFRAFATGDPAAVRDSGVEADESTILALAEATETLRDPTVETLEEQNGSSLVTLSYRLGGAEHRTRVAMTEKDGRWRPAEPLTGTLTAWTPWGTATVGRTTLGDSPLALLPAVYSVRTGPVPFVTGEKDAIVVPSQETTVTLVPSLTDEAVSMAKSRLDEYLETCARTASVVPENCGIRLPWGVDLATLDGVRFRIERMPALSLDPPSFAATGGVLVATVTGTDHSGAPASATFRTDAWSVRGNLAVTADGVALAVR